MFTTRHATVFAFAILHGPSGCERSATTETGAREEAAPLEEAGPSQGAPAPDDAGDLSLTPPTVDAAHPPAARHAVGEKASATDYELIVSELRECKVEDYFEPRPENFLLGVKVTLAGLTGRQVPVSPFHALLKDESGNEYRPTLAGCRPSLRSQRIDKEEEASGYVTFEIPRSARGLTLSYAPFIVGGASQTLSFDLGR
ncbi:MAG TPA: DUF4352 domain-containing protein [Polyangiaceae bacterium]